MPQSVSVTLTKQDKNSLAPQQTRKRSSGPGWMYPSKAAGSDSKQLANIYSVLNRQLDIQITPKRYPSSQKQITTHWCFVAADHENACPAANDWCAEHSIQLSVCCVSCSQVLLSHYINDRSCNIIINQPAARESWMWVKC